MYQGAVLGGFYEMLETFQQEEKKHALAGGRGIKHAKNGGFYGMLENMEEFANVSKRVLQTTHK
jgi:hypothetical protein